VGQAVAAGSYLALGGSCLGVAGDGLIPVDTALLPGCRHAVVPGCHHAGFVPAPGPSLQLPPSYEWYGSAGLLDAWLPAVQPGVALPAVL
jgi:hypothetical protein